MIYLQGVGRSDKCWELITCVLYFGSTFAKLLAYFYSTEHRKIDLSLRISRGISEVS